MKCKNCAFEFEGNFCPRCGQNAGVKRFTFSYFLKETFFSSLDIEQGFFSSIKALLIKPGIAIRNYLEGKRLTLAVPGKYLILIGAVSTFLAVQYEIFRVPEISSRLQILPDVQGFFRFAVQYTTVINIVTIPIFAFFSWLFFIKKNFNYTENMILNIFITSQQLLILIVMIPALEIFEDMNSTLITSYTFITVVYNVWVYIQFFRLKIVQGILVSLAAILLSYSTQFFFNYCLYMLLPQQWIEWLA